MGKYVVKRLLLAVLTCFVILTLTFVLMKCLPFTYLVTGLRESFMRAMTRNGIFICFTAVRRKARNGRFWQRSSER